MADQDPPSITAVYPVWQAHNGAFVTMLDEQLVEVVTEILSSTTWRYVARVGERIVLTEEFDVSEGAIGNIRAAWERLAVSLPEAMMEYLL